MRLGIAVFHGRPRHPQTQGKDERFHRTLRLELLHDREFRDLAEAQREFDRWREVYNFVRPVQALALEPPASRLWPSPRAFPERLPPVETRPISRSARCRPTRRSAFTAVNSKSAKPSLACPSQSA